MEPAGYSFSQKGTKFRLAARTMGSASGRPINTTSCPRDCSLRASAVMGFRCPATGMLTKPIFIGALLLVHREPSLDIWFSPILHDALCLVLKNPRDPALFPPPSRGCGKRHGSRW